MISMSPATSILIGSGIIGLSIVATGLGSHYFADRYELSVATANGDAIGWRLNKRTGVVTICELARDPRAALPPSPDNPFAIFPPVMGSRSRQVDKVMVQCGYE